jgi:PAS domain S-box-containing protein
MTQSGHGGEKSSLFSLGLQATNTHGPSGKLGKSLRCALKSEFRVDQVRDSSRLKIIESRDLATPSEPRSPPQRRNRSGAVDDATNSVQQATGERELRQMLERQKRTFDLAMMASQMGTWRYTLADNICIYDENAQRLYGLTEAHFLHSEEGVKSKFHPDDLERMWSRVSKALDPGSDGRYDAEYRVKQLDGSWRWVSAWGLVEFEGDGADRKPVAIAGASRDITERKQAEELQRLLLNELNHRIKNTLTTIQAITALTLRAACDLPSASVALERRIHSMAQAHDLLTSRTWTGANLTDVVMRALDAFTPTQVKMSGPAIDVSPKHALALSLALHELATNATKYGALSSPEGRVTVQWGVQESMLHLDWQESGGPPVEPPTQNGLGTRLLEELVVRDLAGDTKLTYDASGVRCRIIAAL